MEIKCFEPNNNVFAKLCHVLCFLHSLHKLGNLVPIPAAEAFLQHLLDSTGLQFNAICTHVIHLFHLSVPFAIISSPMLSKLSFVHVYIGWRERNQQDATNLMFIIKLLSQHVSGIIMPIIRRTRPCTTACGVLHWLWLCEAGLQAVCTVWKLPFEK